MPRNILMLAVASALAMASVTAVAAAEAARRPPAATSAATVAIELRGQLPHPLALGDLRRHQRPQLRRFGQPVGALLERHGLQTSSSSERRFARHYVGQRTMIERDGASFLAYNLYTDTGRGTVWGDTVGTNTVAGIGRGMSINNANTHTVFGTIANSYQRTRTPPPACTPTRSR